MRALVSRSASTPLAWADLPDRPLRPDEVRVQVAAAGVNPVDWKMRGFSLLSVAHAIVGPSSPFVPGVDCASVVTEAGTAVEDLRPGDPVVGGTDFSRRQRGSHARSVSKPPTFTSTSACFQSVSTRRRRFGSSSADRSGCG